MQRQVDHRRAHLAALSANLDALSALKVLERGFAVVRDDDGRVLKSVASFEPDMAFRVTVVDGDVRARVVGDNA